MYAPRLLACAVISVALHLLLGRGMSSLPRAVEPRPPALVTVRLVPAPPPPPEPEKPPPEAPKPERPVHEKPRRRPVATDLPREEQPARDTPPTERPAARGEATGQPVFGISMESTSQAGRGPALPTGNTVQAKPGAPVPGKPKPMAAPVQAHEVTKMPLPKGRCTGKYTDAARAAAIEGTVVLDLVVGEDGKTREIIVVQGLAHGLTEAAVSAVKSCRFTPGEREGHAVPVRVRGFKIRFFLQESGG
jgi:TonB family protein